MKKSRIIPAILISVVFLMGTLAACGKTAEPATSQEEQQAKAPEQNPEDLYPATVDPAHINPGSLISEEDITDTSDRWYPNGDTSSEYFFMLNQTQGQDSNIGLDLTFCKGQGDGYLFSATDLQAENGHAKTQNPLHISGEDEGTTYEFDLTFQDNFTCYNFIDNCVWKRAHTENGCKDAKWYDDAIAGHVAYREFSGDSYQKITFAEDHTFTEENDDDPNETYTGKWEVAASNLLYLIYDDPEAAGIADAVDVTEALGFEGGDGETINTGIWHQLFNIDSSGKITEFGIFPSWDADGNKELKSAFWFGTEEERTSAEEALATAKDNAVRQDLNDLTGVDLDTTPSVVIEADDYDGAAFLAVDFFNDKHLGEIIELNGEVFNFGSLGIYVRWHKPGDDSTTKDIDINISDMSWQDYPETGTHVKVTGIAWRSEDKPTTTVVCTDSAHFIIED